MDELVEKMQEKGYMPEGAKAPTAAEGEGE
jgi:hypothetical protein